MIARSAITSSLRITSVMGGHVTIGDHAVIGGAAALHQFVRIGRAAMVGGVSGVEGDVIPFGSVIGNRARLAGLNVIGLKRRGFSRTANPRAAARVPVPVPPPRCLRATPCRDARPLQRRSAGDGGAGLHLGPEPPRPDPLGRRRRRGRLAALSAGSPGRRLRPRPPFLGGGASPFSSGADLNGPPERLARARKPKARRPLP